MPTGNEVEVTFKLADGTELCRVENLADITTFLEQHEEYVKVVRCKDCLHKPVWKLGRIDKFAEPPSNFNTFENFMAGKTTEDYTCPYLWDSEGYYEMPEDDFFCKLGEKR